MHYYQGDSGGPVIVNDGQDKRLVGIVSQITTLIKPDTLELECSKASVHTRVADYSDWIHETMRRSYDDKKLKGSFQLIPVNSSDNKYCLDVSSGRDNTANADVHMWECLGVSQTNQLWRLEAVEKAYYEYDQDGNKIYKAAYHIRALYSNKCLDVEGNETNFENGKVVRHTVCTNEPKKDQLWKLVQTSRGYYQIRAIHSDSCLDVSSGVYAPKNGTKVQQWRCRGSLPDNQLWKIIPVGDFQIVAEHSNSCLDISGESISDNANVHQWSCGGENATNQLWRPIHVGDGWYQMMAVHSGKCLTVRTPSRSVGENVFQSKCQGPASYNQLWRLEPKEDSFQIVVRHNEQCLDVEGGENAKGDGTNVQITSCTPINGTKLWNLKYP